MIRAPREFVGAMYFETMACRAVVLCVFIGVFYLVVCCCSVGGRLFGCRIPFHEFNQLPLTKLIYTRRWIAGMLIVKITPHDLALLQWTSRVKVWKASALIEHEYPAIDRYSRYALSVFGVKPAALESDNVCCVHMVYFFCFFLLHWAFKIAPQCKVATKKIQKNKKRYGQL